MLGQDDPDRAKLWCDHRSDDCEECLTTLDLRGDTFSESDIRRIQQELENITAQLGCLLKMPGDPFYRSTAWREFRAATLAANPMCAAMGCKQPSHHVDHVVSRRKGGAEFDLTNCLPLCASCHSRKSVTVDGGFGRSPRGYQIGCDADGKPIDPSHPWKQ